MYIALESYSEQDPRLVPEMEFIDSLTWAIFNVCYIKPENVSKVDFSNLNYEELTPELYSAFKFLSATDDYKLSIAADSDISKDFVSVSSLEAHDYKPKVKYTLTDADKAQLVNVYKLVMRLYLTHHYNNLDAAAVEFNKETRARIAAEVESLTDVDQCRVMMHTKFGISCSSKLAERLNLGTTQIQLSNRIHTA